MAHKANSERTSEESTVEIEIRYVRGAHNRDADPIDPDEDEEIFHLTRELTRGPEALEGMDVESVLDRAYVPLADPVELDKAPLDPDDEEDLTAIVEEIWRTCQGPGSSATYGYDGREWRSMSVGDVVVVNGTPVMIDRFGIEVLDVDLSDDEDDLEAATARAEIEAEAEAQRRYERHVDRNGHF